MDFGISNPVLIETLQGEQKRLLNFCKCLGKDFNKQAHPDLSPPGWHLGHCIFTENYWLRERLMGIEFPDAEQARLYNPEFSEKRLRGMHIPSLAELLAWARESHASNLRSLARVNGKVQEPQLLQDDYLIHFLIQHYAQHYETLQIIKMQQALSQTQEYIASHILQGSAIDRFCHFIPQGRYRVGSETPNRPYDNEYPAYTIEINRVAISHKPVSNAEYLGFMEDGGYRRNTYWCDAGWQWVRMQDRVHPEYWCLDTAGHWYGLTPQGPTDLRKDEPVYGINWYEAKAFARWAGGRLPHEHEWETARRLGLLEATGQVWEWCDNPFFPYPGFRAFPYDGYSSPYFDGAHYILKGGSCLSRNMIKRASFRNYYQADKRFLYAGLRLVYDP